MNKDQASEKLLSLGIVPTRSFVDVYKKIHTAIKNKSILVVTGEPGLGKTTIKRVTIGRFKEDVTNYVVIEPEAGLIKYKETTSAIMNLMIEKISGERPKRDIISKAEQLKNVMKRTSRNIIVSIDESQDLGMDAIYGLKKLHELGGDINNEYLFTITLFGKPTLTDIVKPDELKHRVTLYEMKQIAEKEVELFLKVYEIKFTKINSLKNFARVCGCIPMQIKTACMAIKLLVRNGMTPDQALNSYAAGDVTELWKATGLKYTDLGLYIFRATGKSPDKSSIGRAINGESNTEEAKLIRKMAVDMANEALV